MKKILALFLAFAMMFSVISPVSAESKYDEAGKVLEDLGLLKGDGKGNLGLDSNLLKQHMIVMISRLYNEGDEASKFEGINKFKDLQPKHKQDIPFITWASNKGLINGKPDGTFGIDEDVTVQEYQTVLLRALGYEKDAKDWDMVPKLSDSYGLMKDLDVDPSSKMSRGVMAVMTLNALRQEKNGEQTTLAESLNIELPDEFKVNSTVTVKSNSIIFEGQVENTENLWITLKPISSSIKMDEKYSPIPLSKDGNFTYEVNGLEVGEYQYRFQSGQETTSYKSVKIDIRSFALLSIEANNLKEIHLKFTHPVNKNLTFSPSNYSTTAGSIKDVRFEEENKKIILTLNEIMSEGSKYKISANKIKSESGEETKLANYEFEASDSKSPQVKWISQLGNKGIRVYFSEPIKRSLATNFTVNEEILFGKAIYENNNITLLYHSSAEPLPNGEHELILSDVEDYSGRKLDKNNHNFTLKDDDKAPSIKSISSTLERVVFEFDKDIDPESVTTDKIYWQEDKIKHPQSVEVTGNKITADFSNNILSPDGNTMYVLEIKDYFGNKFSQIVEIKPIIDTTTAEVTNFKVSDDGTTITIYYNKSVNGNDKEHYSISSEDNKAIDIREISGSGREYKIHLYSPLPLGSNSLVIDGVSDATNKEDTVLRFKAEVEIKDTENPKVTSHTGYGNNIVINFSKEMDEDTIINPSNYIMKFKGEQHKLPANTSFLPSKDGKTITILLPEDYNGDKIMIGRKENLTELDITNLKDSSQNNTNPLILNIKFNENSTGKAKSTDYYSEIPDRQGVLTKSNLIKVKFNMPIVYASKYDFSVKGRDISDVIADGSDIVTIHLDDKDFTSIPSRSLRVLSDNDMRTYIDTGVESETLYLLDELAPRIKKDISSLRVYRDQIEIPFTEDLEVEGASLYRRDLEVIRLKDNKLLSEYDYTTSLDAKDSSILIVEINNRDISSEYSIRLAGQYDKDKLSYIRDKDGNLAIPSSVYTTSKDI